MFVLPKYDGPYTVFMVGGEVAVFDTKAKVVRQLGGYRAMQSVLCSERPGNINAWQAGVNTEDDPFWDRRPRFLVLNSLGDALTRDDFSSFAPEQPEVWLGSYWRGFPGSRRAAYRNWMRYPRTQNERSMNGAALAEEGEPRARNVRLGNNLPSSWDDLYRTSQRSWKEHRRKQYRS